MINRALVMWTWTIAAVMFFALSDNLKGQEENLLENPGFEEVEADGMPVGWVPSTWGAPPQIAVDETVFHIGKRSARIDNSSVFWEQSGIIVNGGGTYKFSFWGKCENIVSDEKPGVACFFYYDIGGRKLMDVYDMEGTVDWKKFTKIITAPENATTLKLMIGQYKNKAGGKFWLDDVELISLGD